MQLLWISLRYFFSPDRRTIHLLLVFCYSAGIVILLVILAVMNSLQADIIADLIQYQSFSLQADMHPSLSSILSEDDRVQSSAMFEDVQVLMQTPSETAVPATLRFVSQSYIRDTITAGFVDDGLVISLAFARTHDLSIGDRLALTVIPENLQQNVYHLTIPIAEFVNIPLVGDSVFVGYYPLEQLELRDDATLRMGVFLHDENQARAVQHDIHQRIPGLDAKTWLELNKNILAALRLEKTAMVFFMLILFVVVAYCTAQMVSRSFAERYQDIAILRSMGATLTGVQLIFFGEAIILACISGLFGTMIALYITVNLHSIVEGVIALRYGIQEIAYRAFSIQPRGFPSFLLLDIEGKLRVTTLFFVQFFCTTIIYLASVRVIKNTKQVSLSVLLRNKRL